MLDINLILNNADDVKEKLESRGFKLNIDLILKLSLERKKLIGIKESLAAEKNKVSDKFKKLTSDQDKKNLKSESKELESNIILACRATPLTDCVIAPANDEYEDTLSIKNKTLSLKLLSIERATPTVSILTFSLPNEETFNFLPGQYANIKFSSLPYRSYSMANLPGEQTIEFHIKDIKDGEVSEYIVNKINIGESVKIKGPEGKAHLREQHTGPILAIAGGTGIAPIKSIVTSVLKSGFTKPIDLYFGARKEEELYLINYFEDLKSNYKNLNFIPALSEPDSTTHKRVGLITDVVMEDIENFEDYTAYIAGQPEMVLFAQEILFKMGVPKSRIHADAFFTQYDNPENKK